MTVGDVKTEKKPLVLTVRKGAINILLRSSTHRDIGVILDTKHQALELAIAYRRVTGIPTCRLSLKINGRHIKYEETIEEVGLNSNDVVRVQVYNYVTHDPTW